MFRHWQATVSGAINNKWESVKNLEEILVPPNENWQDKNVGRKIQVHGNPVTIRGFASYLFRESGMDLGDSGDITVSLKKENNLWSFEEY